MLFNANITAETMEDEDKLTEQLYVFLKNYVISKLRYEDADTKEDCIQDTLMVLIRKARELTEEQKKTLNLEQYFYNRANSYVSSIWFRKLNTHRNRHHNEARLLSYQDTSEDSSKPNSIIDMADYSLGNQQVEPTYNHIDYELIANLVEAYRLPFNIESCVLQEVENSLTDLGYGGNKHPMECLDINKDTLKVLTMGIVDEYILHSLNKTKLED